MAFQIEKKQTNADKYFRSATDEEIAEWICSHDYKCPPGHKGIFTPYCVEVHGCKFCWRNWLKQEVESDA